MKKTLVLVLFPLIFSCSKSEKYQTANILENLVISVDTVMIDSKDQIFDLNRGPHKSSISEDSQHLFLFNSNTSQIQQINLDKLEWEKDIDFEVEGPNGIGEVVLGTKVLGDGTFLITGYRKMGIFDESGTKTKDFSISSLPISTDLEELEYGIILSKNHKNLYSFPGIQYEGPRNFARIDLETFEIENYPIPEMHWIFDLKVIYVGGYIYQEYMYARELNNQILILSPSTSAFYKYDPAFDSLSYHSFVHQLSPSENTVQLKVKVESMEEYEEEMDKFLMAFNFGSLIWDETRGLYFRFGRKPINIEESFERGASQVFLYLYDEDFKLIGETEIKEFTKVPEYPFFKDGKLWSYVNVEDELGFAVVEFKF